MFYLYHISNNLVLNNYLNLSFKNMSSELHLEYDVIVMIIIIFTFVW